MFQFFKKVEIWLTGVFIPVRVGVKTFKFVKKEYIFVPVSSLLKVQEKWTTRPFHERGRPVCAIDRNISASKLILIN